MDECGISEIRSTDLDRFKRQKPEDSKLFPEFWCLSLSEWWCPSDRGTKGSCHCGGMEQELFGFSRIDYPLRQLSCIGILPIVSHVRRWMFVHWCGKKVGK